MCGILAALSYFPIDRNHFDRSRDSLGHRGPDSAGSEYFQSDYVALGHRRLAILDLSTAANQPMRLGYLWITYNGEIYNYKELKSQLEKQGCHFCSNSDTEVLLHGYRIWGKDLCSHLSGMFAFCIWDDSLKELFVARDHIGQKPLYYASLEKQFVIASEIKAIKAFVGGFKMREESFIDFLIYDCVPDPNTWFKGINSLEPGFNMMVTKKSDSFKCEINKYWDYTPNIEPAVISTSDALEQMGEEIRKTVRMHLLADVEVGAFLSGGTDSSSIVSLASRYLNHPIRTFSIGYGSPNGGELPLARLTARMVGAIHKERIVSEEDYQTSINKVLDMFDQPFADSSLVPTERVAALAAEDVKVVLTGDGGDEIFGGYNLGWYLSPWLSMHKYKLTNLNRGNIKMLLTDIVEKIYYAFFGASRWQGKDNFLRHRATKNRVIKLVESKLAPIFREYDPHWAYKSFYEPKLDPLRRAQWLHIKVVLPGKMLMKVDRCTMTHSLEARSPFLSHRLVEMMLNMPTEVRNPVPNWYKALFRMWLKGLIPEAVLV